MRFKESLIRLLPGEVLKHLGAERRGRFEYIRGHHKHFYALGGPMNGQAHRLEIARSIIERCGIEAIIETGTHRAATAVWFAQFGLPVHTVELNPQFHAFSAERVAEFRNVSLSLGGSVAFLRQIQIGKRRLFIYLDAHWDDNLPLADELHTVWERFPHSIVMIDDFAVPDDAGYRYDDYGPGKALTLAYLEPLLPYHCELFWPSAHSRWETGAKRGCVVMTRDQELALALRRLPTLRPQSA